MVGMNLQILLEETGGAVALVWGSFNALIYLISRFGSCLSERWELDSLCEMIVVPCLAVSWSLGSRMEVQVTRESKLRSELLGTRLGHSINLPRYYLLSLYWSIVLDEALA